WFRERTTHSQELRERIGRSRVAGQPLDRAILNSEFEFEDFRRAIGDAAAERSFPRSTLFAVFAERKYAVYLDRQRAEIRRVADIEHRRLPDDIDYHSLGNLRTEAR